MTARPSSLSVLRSQVRNGSRCLSPCHQRRLSVRAQRTASSVAPRTGTLFKASAVRHAPRKIVSLGGAPEGAQGIRHKWASPSTVVCWGKTLHKSKATKAVCCWAVPEGAEIMKPAVIFTLPVVSYVRQSKTGANPAVNLAPFGRWTLRDKAAQRRLPLR